MNKIENAVIFAAGKGTRMAPLTQYLPKSLVKVHGEPIIERNITFLRKAGIKKIIIVVGYLKEQFKYLERKYNVKLIGNKEYDSTNNISSLITSMKYLNNTLYVEGDIYQSENMIPEIVRLVQQENDSIAFSLLCKEHIGEWGYVVNDKGYVDYHRYFKDAYMKYIWSGFLFLKDNFCDEIRKNAKAWYDKVENKQKYFELYFWEMQHRMKHVQILDDNIHELDNFSDLIKIDHRYANQSTTLLFTPGPINNLPEVSDILAESVLHHRSQLFKYYMQETTELMKEFMKTKDGLPLFLTASATGAMEAIVVNLIEPGNKVLLIEAGDFGKRFQIIIEKLIGEKNLTTLSYPDGQSYEIKDVEKALKNNRYDAIFLTHHETSTGVLHNVQAVSELIQKYAKDSLFIVDTVSSFIHENVEFDKWHLDAAIATSGKAFCVMPGLSCVVLSPRAQEVVKKNKNFKFYFDLSKYIDYYNNEKSTPYTSATSILLAMNASFKVMKNQTLDSIRKYRARIYNYIEKQLLKLGFKSVVKPENVTHGLLVMNTPEGYDAEVLRNTIEYKNNIYFELGRLNRRKTQVRIGLPNVIGMDQAKLLVEAIKENLKDAKIN